MSIQLTFGSADVAEPTPADLAGLLCGPGEVVRVPGLGARVSVVLEEPWRVEELLRLLESVGLPGDTAPAEGGGTSVRSPVTQQLVGLAESWTHGSVQLPPPGFELTGVALRAWLVAAGGPVPGKPAAWQLRLGDAQEAWAGIGAALARAGVPGVLVGPRAGGPAYRIMGSRRLRRLAELVGESPASAPPLSWPLRDLPSTERDLT